MTDRRSYAETLYDTYGIQSISASSRLFEFRYIQYSYVYKAHLCVGPFMG